MNNVTNDKAKKFVITLAVNATDDRSTIAFTVANAALAAGRDVGIFLSSDAVELSRAGSCDYTNISPFKPLAELIDAFTNGGGIVWACSPCVQHRSLKDAEMAQGVKVVGAGPMLEWIDEGAATLSF